MNAETAELTSSLKSLRLGRWDGVSPSSLSLALSPPVTQCVETGLEAQLRAQRRRIVGQLSLLVTTKSAYRHSVVRPFIEAIAKRTVIDGDLHERIYTAIQEALMNAVLHGNLQIEMGARESLEGLTKVHASIERLLAQPEIALGMIRVDALWSAKMLYVIIRDSGHGYRKDKLPSSAEREAAGRLSSGRGLSILESICDRVTLIHGGSAIKLGFRL